MSFLSLVARRAQCSRQLMRWNSTSAPSHKSPSNWPLLFLVGGCAGLGAYIYFDKYAQQTVSPFDPEKWVDLKLKKVDKYNHNTASFTFELPGNQASLLPVASCVVVKSTNPEDLKDAKGKPVIRPYTPVSPSHAKGELTFLVKNYEAGVMSKYIHTLRPGATLSIKGPILKLEYKANEFEEIGLIAGGSGITPMYQVLTHALSDKANKTKFKLLFANVREEDILLREEFDALKKKYPNTFDVVYILDHPPEKWTGPKGYITADLIKQHIAPPSLKDKVKVFVCGPPPQVAALAGPKAGMKQGDLGGVLKELGYTQDQVFKF